VVFVLATTEKHKVLPTIISRCQSFDFRRPGVETLGEKLAEIANAEGIEAEPEALTVIAREGRGSFRDAEGLLDQLSSFSEGRITASMVRELLGSVGPGVLLETTAALHERRAADALRIVDRLSNEGRDLGQFVGELLSHLRVLMLLPHAPEVALAEVGAEERAPLKEQANAVPTAEVVRLVEALGDTLGRVRRGGDPKLELELSFLKLARDYTEPSVENLLGRLERLEKAAENGGLAANTSRPAPEVPRSESRTEEQVTPASIPPEAADEPHAGPDEASTQDNAGGGRTEDVDLAPQWGSIMGELKRHKQALTAAVYGEARVEGFDGKVLRLVYPEEQGFHVDMAKDPAHVQKLGAVLEESLGSKPRLEVRAAGGEAAAPVTEEPPPPAPTEQRAPDPRPAFEEPPPETGSPNGSATPEAENRAPETDAAEADGSVQNELEVFEIAREQDPDN
jgi:DNA polymerase III subunit gamma/tau